MNALTYSVALTGPHSVSTTGSVESTPETAHATKMKKQNMSISRFLAIGQRQRKDFTDRTAPGRDWAKNVFARWRPVLCPSRNPWCAWIDGNLFEEVSQYTNSSELYGTQKERLMS